MKIPYNIGLEYCRLLKVNGYSQSDLDFGTLYVYCDDHEKVHGTGWCSVKNYRKVALDFPTFDDAVAHATRMGFLDEDRSTL